MFIDGKLGRKQHEAASASASRLKYNVNLSQNATVKVFYDVCLGPEEEHLFIVHISNPVNFPFRLFPVLSYRPWVLHSDHLTVS